MSRQKNRSAARARTRRTSRTGVVVAIIAVALVAVGGLYVVATRPGASGGSPAQTAAVATGGPPTLRVEPAVYDLGSVSQARGLVTVELAVANTGTGALTITEMETSCGCTKAAIVSRGVAGPWFGMRGHGDWPTGWSATIAAGDRATLRVQYDPDAHGIYRGPIDRVVVIYSNDPRRPQAQVRLTGTQIP